MDASLMDSVQERCMKIRFILIVTGCAVLLLGGCGFFGQSNGGAVSSADLARLQKVFMSSYFAERGGTPGGAKALTPFLRVAGSSSAGAGSKATVPVSQLTNNNFATLSPMAFVNYPEPGQTTTFTITTKDAGNHVYDVIATTTFPSDDIRKSYVEEYYVMDGNPTYSLGPDNVWTTADAIVRLSGGLWVQDQKARVQQVLTFSDGTTRNETIVAMSPSATTAPLFDKTAFNINGSLDFSQTFYPIQAVSDPTIQFSSVVMYYVTPSTNPNFWFWQGQQQQTILGIRYYTESWTSTTLTTYTVCFEKTIGTLTTTNGSFTQTLNTVFAGSQFSTLAESVLRQQVTYNLVAGVPDLSSGTEITNMQTRVANITGQKDFYLSQSNSDYVTLSSWATSTIYTPTPAANQVITADPSAFAYSRTLTSSSGSLPLYYPSTQITDTTGTGDLAILYTSIQEGQAAISTGSSTIPGSIPQSGFEWQYNGAQGTTIANSSSYQLGDKGTVSAWVYISQLTDTAGIVHKGVQPNFSDEDYSLQFWGNQGQIAWIIDNPSNPGNQYDLLTSTINLNPGKWYYIVATWDDTAGPKYNNLYINGTLNNSMTPSWTPEAAGTSNTSAVIIGSQLPTQYDATYGYFGFNGKINGVSISSTPMSAATVAANYATYIVQTPSW
jgi:Concanavalin A-like lectin/glucanases superfamily